MSHVAFTLLAWGSGPVGESMQQGLTSLLQPCLECLRSGSMDGEVAQTGKMLSGSMKPFCAASPKGRAGSVLIGAQCRFMVVSQWGWSSSTYRGQFICVAAAHWDAPAHVFSYLMGNSEWKGSYLAACFSRQYRCYSQMLSSWLALGWAGGEHPQLIRNRYLSAGNTARQKPFCISQCPRNLQHLNKPHGERHEFFTPISPNLIIKNSMQTQEGRIPVTFCFYWLKFPVRWASGYRMENLSSLTSPSVLGGRMESGCFFLFLPGLLQ